MKNMKRWVFVGAAAAVVVAAGGGIALATASDDDQPLSGTTLEQATKAALAHTGGGTVLETEGGDDGAAYGVEVRTPDGAVVEVSLDSDFRVIGQETDDDGSPSGGEDD